MRGKIDSHPAFYWLNFSAYEPVFAQFSKHRDHLDTRPFYSLVVQDCGSKSNIGTLLSLHGSRQASPHHLPRLMARQQAREFSRRLALLQT